MEIVWTEANDLRAFAGHGVDYLSDLRGAPQDVIAVVRGFAWFHGAAGAVEVLVRPADDLFSDESLEEAKRVIALDLADFQPGPDIQLSPSLFRHVNA
jgi:hypothetical protein